jgi:predicted RND superfamily exporter protein
VQAAPPGDVTVTAAGFGRLFGDQEALLIEGQVKGLIAAVFLIFALMALQWRSVRASALCMVPNLAPVLLIFGLMGALGIWLDMATAMIASVTVGIAVDDTIHLYHGYRHRLAAGTNPVWALARSHQYAGRAVTATTLILVPQFLLLATSQFVPTMEFGLLTAIGLLVALAFDLLVLPAMLVVLHARRRLPAAR